jgi:hypothetical protein
LAPIPLPVLKNLIGHATGIQRVLTFLQHLSNSAAQGQVGRRALKIWGKEGCILAVVGERKQAAPLRWAWVTVVNLVARQGFENPLRHHAAQGFISWMHARHNLGLCPGNSATTGRALAHVPRFLFFVFVGLDGIDSYGTVTGC